MTVTKQQTEGGGGGGGDAERGENQDVDEVSGKAMEGSGSGILL